MFIHVVIRRGWSLEHVAPTLQHFWNFISSVLHTLRDDFLAWTLVLCIFCPHFLCIDRLVTPQTTQKHTGKMNPHCSLQPASISIYTYSQFSWWLYLMLLVSIIWIATPYARIATFTSNILQLPHPTTQPRTSHKPPRQDSLSHSILYNLPMMIWIGEKRVLGQMPWRHLRTLVKELM